MQKSIKRKNINPTKFLYLKKKKQPLLLFWCIFLLFSSFLYIRCAHKHDYRALQALGE